MNELKAYLDQITQLTSEEWEAFSSLFETEKLTKGEYFAEADRKERKIGFLIHGVIRAFFRNKDGQEYNKTFFTQPGFFGGYASMVTETTNHINVQALTDCHIITADFSKIRALFEPHRGIERLARIIAENLYANKEKREIEMALLQADERYDLFKKEHPNLENLIPQYHVASYLSITPTQLSRIRAKK